MPTTTQAPNRNANYVNQGARNVTPITPTTSTNPASYVNQGASSVARTPAQQVNQGASSVTPQERVVSRGRTSGGSSSTAPSSTETIQATQPTPQSIQSTSSIQTASPKYQQSFGQSTIQATQILGSNIKYNIGAAFSDKPYQWQPVLSPFQYSGELKGEQPDGKL